MRKGISIWSFADAKLENAFALAKRAGFEGVEVALAEEGELTLKTSERDALRLKQLAADSGIALYSVASGLYWSFNYTAADPATRQKAKDITKKQLELASALGCDTILVVPGAVGVDFVPGSEIVPYKDAYQRALDALSELAPFAQQANVAIGIENVWNKFLLSPLEMLGLIEKIGHPFVGAYFDVGNVLYSGYPEHWIEILGKHIKKVHLKDYRRQAGGLHGFVDLLAGDVDYPAVMRAFEKIGYDGWLTAEMLPPYTHHPEAIIHNTSRAMDFIMGRETR